ncbi:maleate cis-trans isomerase family protein [Novosphingobium decolorationis]|uniref:Arylmalonate decarboxylase n=1 Tax=Novosphingobium decolorationis TaxID=2698673 RepID=A0ABX8E4L3_9SPHN|nr:arylmalonate decarboxylase [Novosphingobium decolorationis]QVM83875.1 arylmalonate decarboxylase [Novosphingobium decolorationis]
MSIDTVPGRVNRDQLGFRRKFGVLGPSTNTSVQPDFDDLRVPGVTNHYSRIVVDNAKAVSNETFMAGAWEISDNTVDAVKGVLTCAPDYLVMGMSAVTFFGGAEGADTWRRNVEEISGLGVSTGADSVVAALKAYGPGIRKVAFFSPYFPTANAEVKNFLADHGYETVRDIALQCPSWLAIAEVEERRTIDTFKALDGDDVDALIQVGTNISGIRAAAAAELYLGKPVIAINTATYWHALRANGIQDRLMGFGRLMSEF